MSAASSFRWHLSRTVAPAGQLMLIPEDAVEVGHFFLIIKAYPSNKITPNIDLYEQPNDVTLVPVLRGSYRNWPEENTESCLTISSV